MHVLLKKNNNDVNKREMNESEQHFVFGCLMLRSKLPEEKACILNRRPTGTKKGPVKGLISY